MTILILNHKIPIGSMIVKREWGLQCTTYLDKKVVQRPFAEPVFTTRVAGTGVGHSHEDPATVGDIRPLIFRSCGWST